MEYLQLYCNVLPNWPANSPDMNPIENLWAIMKDHVEELEPANISDLKQILIQVWDGIEDQTIKNLIDSMPSRLQAVLNANGGPNGY